MTHTPGPWILATSNSWRRFQSARGLSVCEPIAQNDGHPDLYFRNGGPDGPDASLIAAAPELLNALRWSIAHEGECLGDYQELLDAARALLARATGEPTT